LHILLRADAGALIGAGHVMRCLALAQALQEPTCDARRDPAPNLADTTNRYRSITCRLIAADLPERLTARLIAERVLVERIDARPGSKQDLAATLAWVERDAPAAVVLDGYEFGTEYRRALRARVPLILTFDDLADLPALHADLVVNAAPTAAALAYSRIAPGATLLLGPAYAPLRREFRLARQRAAGVPVGARNAVLVSFGGSDPLGLTEPVTIALADRLPASVRLLVAVGAGLPEPDRLRASLAKLGDRLCLHLDAQDMAVLMASSGLAVAAAGGTAGELAALGIPSVLVIVADNQAPTPPSEIDRDRIIDARGRPRAEVASVIAARAAALWAAPAARERLAGQLAARVDADGALRIAAALLAAVCPTTRLN